MKKFFLMNSNEVLNYFNVSKDGLSSDKASENLRKFGHNELSQKKKDSLFKVFLNQFKDLLVIILMIAAIISLSTGHIESTLVIFSVIILNAILGTVQHFKAEQSLDSLRALSSPLAKVFRDSKKKEIQSKDIVPGDILILEAGDMIVADGRIIESFSLSVNESSLTGESESVNKFIDSIKDEEVSLGDQKNMVFSGSLVTYGRALVVVTSTGMDTEIGKIAHLMEETSEKQTPLQVSLDDFSKKLAIAILFVCIIVFSITLYRGSTFIDSLMFSVALAVAAIPEALSSIVTIVLAIGTQKMARENAIVKKLKAVEGLGSVSIICSDKTGTLTQNKMTVQKIYVNNRLIENTKLDLNDETSEYLIKSSILCNDSTSKDGIEIGDPTEVALVNLAHKLSLNEFDIRLSHNRLAELPFDSDRKLMSTVNDFYNKNLMFTKGAVDVLLNRTTKIKTKDGIKEISYEDKQNILNANKKLSQNGLRVLAFAFKELSSTSISLDNESDFTFLGLISMIDPPREESKKAVLDCISAGIKPVMITGDHKITASAIAKQIGILRENDKAIEGYELEKMTDSELIDNVESISVYARVSPEHKIRIVKAFQAKNEIVAMTGDGVNDAPALKQADIGIAMGITGTEVSKDASSVILMDDNFATIVKSIANGRNIYNNIKNSIRFLLSGNASGILCVLYTSLLNLPIPFAAVHLLFINLVTDSLPAIAIGMEKSKKDLLKEKPRLKNSSILSKDFIFEISLEGLIIAVFTLLSYHIGLKFGKDSASTMAFATLCLARLFHGFNCRSSKSIFSIGLFSNLYSLLAFGVGLILLNIVLFVPYLKNLFEVSSLYSIQIQYVYILAFAPTIIIQIAKVMRDLILNKIKSNNHSSNEDDIDKVA